MNKVTMILISMGVALAAPPLRAEPGDFLYRIVGEDNYRDHLDEFFGAAVAIGGAPAGRLIVAGAPAAPFSIISGYAYIFDAFHG